jgi:hypothetical protein
MQRFAFDLCEVAVFLIFASFRLTGDKFLAAAAGLSVDSKLNKVKYSSNVSSMCFIGTIDDKEKHLRIFSFPIKSNE